MPQNNRTNFQKLTNLVNSCGYDCVEWPGCNWILSPFKTRIVARIAYMIAFGEISDSHIVLRTCDSKKCINPTHLRAVDGVGTLMELIDKNPEDPDECVEWPLARDKRGYGRVAKNGLPAGSVFAHREAWEIKNGVVDPDLDVCHKCDNPSCIRISHLFAASHRENILDALHKGRMRNQFGPF